MKKVSSTPHLTMMNMDGKSQTRPVSQMNIAPMPVFEDRVGYDAKYTHEAIGAGTNTTMQRQNQTHNQTQNQTHNQTHNQTRHRGNSEASGVALGFHIYPQPKQQLRHTYSPQYATEANIFRGRWTFGRTIGLPRTGSVYAPKASFHAYNASPLATILLVPSPIHNRQAAWDLFAQKLALAGFRVLLVDGYDGSTISEIIECVELLAVCGSLPNIPTYLCGSGLGALISTQIASQTTRSFASIDDDGYHAPLSYSFEGRTDTNETFTGSSPSEMREGQNRRPHSRDLDMREDSFDGYHSSYKRPFRTGSYDGLSGTIEEKTSHEPKTVQTPIDGVILLSPWRKLLSEPIGWKSMATKVASGFVSSDTVLPFPINVTPVQSKENQTHSPTLESSGLKSTISALLFAESKSIIAEFDEHLEKLQVPILMIHGSNDSFSCPHAAQEIPELCGSTDITSHLWPQTGHDLVGDADRDLIIESICVWLFSQTRIFHQRSHHARISISPSLAAKAHVQKTTRFTSPHTNAPKRSGSFDAAQEKQELSPISRWKQFVPFAIS